jgi:hypothetical protein
MISDPRYIRLLTLEDPTFYVEELKALQSLEDNKAIKTIADICRDFNLDQYDFKDRWGSLLRHHSPAGVLDRIAHVKQRIGTPIHDIAREFEYTIGTVRNILRKLLEKPESRHIRSKENMAHRIMNQNGGSLKEAKAVLGPRRKPALKPAPARSTEDSLSSSASDSEDNRKSPAIHTEKLPTSSSEVIEVEGTFEAALSLVEDIPAWLADDMQNYQSPKAQIEVLAKLPADPQTTCGLYHLDYPVFYRQWKAVITAIQPHALGAVLYIAVVLTKLGYGCKAISSVIGCSKASITAIAWNLRLYASPSSGRAFDVAVSLLHQEPLKSAKIAEMCSISTGLLERMTARGSKKETVTQQLQARVEDKAVAGRVVWLYERGFPLEVIARALGVCLTEMKAEEGA